MMVGSFLALPYVHSNRKLELDATGILDDSNSTAQEIAAGVGRVKGPTIS